MKNSITRDRIGIQLQNHEGRPNKPPGNKTKQDPRRFLIKKHTVPSTGTFLKKGVEKSEKGDKERRKEKRDMI